MPISTWQRLERMLRDEVVWPDVAGREGFACLGFIHHYLLPELFTSPSEWWTECRWRGGKAMRRRAGLRGLSVHGSAQRLRVAQMLYAFLDGYLTTQYDVLTIFDFMSRMKRWAFPAGIRLEPQANRFLVSKDVTAALATC